MTENAVGASSSPTPWRTVGRIWMLSKNTSTGASKRSLWRRPRAHLPWPKLKCCPLKEVAQQTPPAQHHQPAKSVPTSCINKRLSRFDARLSLVKIIPRFYTLSWLATFLIGFFDLFIFLNILYVVGLVCCAVMSSIYYLLLLILNSCCCGFLTVLLSFLFFTRWSNRFSVSFLYVSLFLCFLFPTCLFSSFSFPFSGPFHSDCDNLKVKK